MTVLVAYDGGALADAVLASARTVAEASGWLLRVLVVDQPDRPRVPGDTPALAGLSVERRAGDPATEIMAAAGDQTVLIALGLRSDDRPGLGSVAERLLLQSDSMLLVLRPGMRALGGVRRIVVPLEGTHSSAALMRRVDELFCRRGRQIVVLHVMTGATPSEPGSLPGPRFVDQEHYDWTSWQEEFELRFSQCTHGGTHVVVVRSGEPAQEAMAEARKRRADLIAVSWRQDLGPGQAERIKRLLQESPCPLLVVGAHSLALQGW